MHDARAIVKELKLYDEALFDKPRWLVLNKLDLVPEDERPAVWDAIATAFTWRRTEPLTVRAARRQGFEARKAPVRTDGG